MAARFFWLSDDFERRRAGGASTTRGIAERGFRGDGVADAGRGGADLARLRCRRSWARWGRRRRRRPTKKKKREAMARRRRHLPVSRIDGAGP